MKISIKNKKITIIIAALLFAFAGCGYFMYTRCCKSNIYNFDEQRDSAFITELFKNDWYWLVAGITEDFSDEAAEYVRNLLHNRSTTRMKKGKTVTIKVGYEGNKPVGFVAYYLKKFYLGRLLFIALFPEFRSTGWSTRLVDYAMNDLISQGAARIDLVTRTNNYAAMKLYQRVGFKETKREDGFVDFSYTVPVT